MKSTISNNTAKNPVPKPMCSRISEVKELHDSPTFGVFFKLSDDNRTLINLSPRGYGQTTPSPQTISAQSNDEASFKPISNS